MATKQDWLDAGLAILTADGVPGLTIERLCAQLGLTKGSFYHHFEGMSGYKKALLEHFEAEFTTRYVTAADAASPDPAGRIQALVDAVTTDPRPDAEVAIRAWATRDDEARAVQHRVDQTRLDYLRSLWLELTGDAAEAENVARLLYLVVIGADYLSPKVEGEQLRALYGLMLSRLANETGVTFGRQS